MRNTITVRLPGDLADWLEETAQNSGISQGKIIRTQLEKAREANERPFMQLAGKIAGAPNLSRRKGFSKK